MAHSLCQASGLLALSSAFSPGIAIARVRPAAVETAVCAGGAIFTTSGGAVSVFAAAPPPPGSVLCENARREDRRVGQPARGTGRWAAEERESMGKIMQGSGVGKNQPVTFR